MISLETVYLSETDSKEISFILNVENMTSVFVAKGAFHKIVISLAKDRFGVNDKNANRGQNVQ